MSANTNQGAEIMATTHTPGPWAVNDKDTGMNDSGTIEGCGIVICPDVYGESRERTNANAALIAAAPAMYEALQMVSTILYDIADSAGDVAEWNEGGQMYELSRVVKTALAQAEGR